MTNVIETRALSKHFGKVRGIEDVALSVGEGKIVGFLGPNGAGKSTTMNILLGFIGASSGSAKIFGEKVSLQNAAIRQEVGFLSSNMALDKTLKVIEELKYFGHLSGEFDESYVRELAGRFGLDLGAKIGGLSTGNYQKVGLIIALMNHPKLLILDEPTNGLDPLVQAEFNKIIIELRNAGATIFISSHILSEVDELCDEFIFIKAGKIVAKLSRSELAKKSGETITIKLDAKNRQKVVGLLKRNAVKYDVEMGSLEDTFMQFYEEEKKDA